MNKPRIKLDSKLVQRAKDLAEKITDDIQRIIDSHSTVSVERTILRLLGVEGTVNEGIPLVNAVVEKIKEKDLLQDGVCRHVVNASMILEEDIQRTCEWKKTFSERVRP